MAETDKPEDDTLTVLCLDVARYPIPGAAGAMRKACAECGTPVWLSPATAAAVAGKVYSLKCPSCMPQPDEDDEVMAPTAGQLDEIRRAAGPEAADRARDLIESPRVRSQALREILRMSRSPKPKSPRKKKGPGRG